jgi:hypothetical protein
MSYLRAEKTSYKYIITRWFQQCDVILCRTECALPYIQQPILQGRRSIKKRSQRKIIIGWAIQRN